MTSYLNGYRAIDLLQNNTINPIQEASQSCMNPLLSSNSRIETYEDLVINLSMMERKDLEDKMNLLIKDDKEINIELLLKAFEKPNLSDPIWKHPNFPLYALLALKEKRIDGMDFSTSQMFYNVINHPNNQGQIQEISLFINDSINPQAWNLIEETVQSFVSQNHQEYIIDQSNINIGPFMTFSQQLIFFNMMAKIRPLQRIFLLISEPKPIFFKRRLAIQNKIDVTITEAINVKNPGFNVFCRVSDKEFGKPLRMIPSKGMMQAYLFAIGGSCTLISQFNLSSLIYLHKGISTGERPMVLNFAFLPKIQKADNLLCFEQANEVEYHDFYHIDLMNLVREDLTKFNGMVHLIQGVIKNNFTSEIEELIWNNIHATLIDMEVTNYRRFYSHKLANKQDLEFEDLLFWQAIYGCLDFLFKVPVELSSFDLVPKTCQVIIRKLIEEADFYQRFYSLNLNFFFTFDFQGCDLQTLQLITFKTFHDAIKKELDFSNQSLKELMKFSEHQGSDLIRSAASKEINKRFTLKKIEKKLNFRNRSVEELLKFSEHQGSYLIVKAALKYLNKTFRLETISNFLIQAKNRKVLTAYFNGLDFVIKQFQKLVDHPTLSSQEKELIYNELRNSPHHFEYLIKSIVLENNIKNFNVLVGVDKEFIEKQLNRVFNDGLTLWQTAALKKNKEMMAHLISLGAKSIEKPDYSELPSISFQDTLFAYRNYFKDYKYTLLKI